MYKKLQFGFTLLEFMITMMVISIMMAIGVPSFLDMITKHRLKGATETIYSDLQLARMEAIKRNRNIRLSFQADGTSSWCYAIHDGNDCNCKSSNNCTMGGQISMVTSGEEFKDVGLITNLKLNSTSFNPVRGTSNSGTITLTSNDISTKVIVSARGRIRVCSNDLTDYSKC